MHEDIMELPGTAAHEAVLKYELKKKCDPKEAQKDERKVLVHSLKISFRKVRDFLNVKTKSLNFKECCYLLAKIQKLSA